MRCAIRRRRKGPLLSLLFLLLPSLSLLSLLAGGGRDALAATPNVAPHALDWFIHEDLVTTERPLAYWTSLLEEATADANLILQGQSGPSDTPCCAALSVNSITTFANVDASRDLLSIDDEAEYDDLDTIGPAGPRFFLVDSLGFCGGSTGSFLGCATRPACNVFPDPVSDRIGVVSVEAGDAFDRLAATIAHERGHNACLAHVTGNACQLMLSSGGGSCLGASECDAYVAAAPGSSADVCECHSAAGTAASDASACTSEAGPAGLCSGGFCGEVGSDASASLVVAAGPDALEGDASDEWLSMSGLTGGWTVSTAFGSGIEAKGLAYSPGRALVYAVAPTGAGTNTLASLDPETGTVSVLGVIEGFEDMVGLAFDPGPSASTDDDRLLALALRDATTTICRQLVAIDPDTASATLLGNINNGCNGDPTSGFQGLAYDSTREKLYATAFFGSGQLWQIDLACSPSCTPTAISNCTLTDTCPDTVFPGRDDPALAYSPASDRLYLLGQQAGPTMLLDSFSAETLLKATTVGIDGFTPGGLAARPTDTGEADSDGDGVGDSTDNCPSDSNVGQEDLDEDGQGDVCDDDRDGDGAPNAADAFPDDASETTDTDGDGTGNNADTDDDGDGLSDADEAIAGTDPLVADSDSDGVDDAADAFPTDASETTDTDGDGTGNNADTDDDGDGLSDAIEISLGSDPLDALSIPAADQTTFDAMGGYQAYLARAENTDLRSVGVCGEITAFEHWRDFGYAEGREFAAGSVVADSDYLIDGGFSFDYADGHMEVFLFDDATKPTGWDGPSLLLEECDSFNLGPTYDATEYRTMNVDVATAIDGGLIPNFLSVTDHYVKYGFKEGRITNLNFTEEERLAFDGDCYLALNPDVQSFFAGTLIAGWIHFGDVGFAHYINFGVNEDRSTCP